MRERLLPAIKENVLGVLAVLLIAISVFLGVSVVDCETAWAASADGNEVGNATDVPPAAQEPPAPVSPGAVLPAEVADPIQPTLSPGWNKVGGLWKYGNAEGYPRTGWLRWHGSWYWLNPERDGAMGTGWQLVDGVWYCMDASGAMQTGWLKVGKTWYHLAPSGAMATQWRKVGGSWYYFGDSGAMATGWRLVGDTWYHLASSGAMDTGWFKERGHWYYLGGDGAMRTGWYKVRGQWNYSNADGVWGESKWVQSGNRWWYKRADGTYPANAWEKIGGQWYHFNAAGWMQTGWLKDGEDWYWLSSSGTMATDTLVDGGRYYVGSDGKWQQATAKLFVLAGHGDGDPGASGSGYNEDWCTRYLAKKLKEFGGDAVMLNDMATNPVKSGIISTMQLPLDTQLLCIHLDSSAASARGGHVIIGNRQPTTYDKALAAAIGSLFPGRPQTIVHRTDLVDVARAAKRGYEYRLLEVCMITNRNDMQKFIASIDDIARAILRSFGIEPVK